MAVVYRASLKNTRLAAVRDDIDSGAEAGTLEILDSDDVILVGYLLEDPCANVVNGVLIFSGFPKTSSNIAIGSASMARIKESGGGIVVSGLTVGVAGSGADIELTTTNISSVGLLVQLSSASITHA
jgi:hypothetical protein